MVAVVEASKVTVAHAGDSRAVMFRSSGAERVTRDHKPDRPDETRRICSIEGGWVANKRVNGALGVSALPCPLLVGHPTLKSTLSERWNASLRWCGCTRDRTGADFCLGRGEQTMGQQ